MDGMNQKHITSVQIISKKSWVAYIVPTIITIVAVAILTSIQLYLGLIPLLFGLYFIFVIRSYQLYMDDSGVWIFSGILPWNKGVHGVKWRDLDEAVYFTGFLSWALKSYKLRLSHRFTKASEIILTNMQKGDQAVQQINEKHKEHLETVDS